MQTKLDEYLPLRWRNAAWVCYACLVCGFINGISLAGVYKTPTSHLTGITTRVAISFASGSDRVGWLSTSGAGAGPAYLVILLFGFGIGAFIAGFTLAEKVGGGSYTSIRLDHPNAREWRWQHQLLLSACMLCLGVALVLVRDQQADAESGNRVVFVAAVFLTACSVAMLNCMVMLGGCSFIVLRASSVTGSLTDTFLTLGSLLRSRSGRHLWKVRLHLIVFFSFVAGGFAGFSVFAHSNLNQSSLAVILLLIGPLWFLGAWFLLHRRFSRMSSRFIEVATRFRESFAPKQSQQVAVVALTATGSDGRLPIGGVAEQEGAASASASLHSLPRLTLLDEFPDEFESEGLGMLIYRLPRINVLEDVEFSVSGEDRSPANRVITPGEYESIHYAHFAWIIYLAFIAGSLNAITFQGIFQQTVTHMTGASTVLVYRLMLAPSAKATPNASFSFGAILCIILAFCLACFVCGFILTAPSSLDTSKYVIRRIDYPNAMEWRWKHQVIVSLCIISLCVSHAIARDFSGSDKNYARVVNYQDPAYSGFLFACACSAFAAGMLNSLSSFGRRITVRSSHVTGTVNDIFLGLGFALRSRSLRFIWRVRVLLFNFFAFFTGGICGSLVFLSSFGATAVMFPAILLAPLWVLGIVLLFVRKLNNRAVKTP